MPQFDAVFDLSTLDGSNGFALPGSATIRELGYSVAAAGDVNGDGFADFIVGTFLAAPNGRYSGSSFVVFGGATFGATFSVSDLDGSNGFRLDGGAAYDEAGRWAAAAGDINGDGFADVIVGAAYADNNGDGSGTAYLVYGKASGFAAVTDLANLASGDGFRIDGPGESYFAGAGVSSAGDLNGDGIDDLLIGAFGAPFHGTNSGSTYVIFGTTSGFGDAFDLNSLDGSNGFRLDGTTAFEVTAKF
ncbi:MAG: FG-GAP repeat protein, partial [Pseudolabrys sp.]|nr:FG-GAP repeat protein [Pseudolabrys sp.]